MPPAEIYREPIAFNVHGGAGNFLDGDDHTDEERKMMFETRKILGDESIAISVTCARVPVISSHSESVNLQTREPLEVEEARALLAAAPGLTLVEPYPTATGAAGHDDVFVGRLRRDPSHERGLQMWVVSDNLRKGAATNAVQLAAEPVQSEPAPPAAEPAPPSDSAPPADAPRFTRPAPPTDAAPDAAPAEPTVAAVAVIEPDAPGAEPIVAAVGLDLDGFAELWPAVIESIQGERPLLAEHLKVARPSALGDGELTLAWAETHGLSRRKAEDPPNREVIGRAIRAVTGASLRLAHEMRADTPETAAPTLSEDELIERFVEEFEAEILPAPDAETKPEETP